MSRPAIPTRDLTAAQRALFERLRAGRTEAPPPAIPPAPDRDRVPLTYAQERIWLSQQLVAEPALYHFVFAVRVPGGVSEQELGDRLAATIARHDAMRISVYAKDGEPFMRLTERVPATIHRLTVAARAGEDLAQACRRTALEFSRPSYRLDRAPLWRVGLAGLPDGADLIVLTMHHLMADGPSMEILGATLSAEGPLPPVAVEFCDYAAWVRSGDDPRAEEWDRWWLDQLAVPPAPLDLTRRVAAGTESGPLGAGTLAGGTVQRYLDPDVSEAVRAFAREVGTSPFAVLVSAFALRLKAASAQERMLFGMSVADRQRPETAAMVGVLMNLVPLVVDLAGLSTLRGAVAQVGAAITTAVEHSSTPFDRLTRLMRSEGREVPKIQVCVNQPITGAGRGPVEVIDLPIVPVGSQFDLTLHVLPGPDGRLQLQAEHAATAFDQVEALVLLDDVADICRRELGVESLPAGSSECVEQGESKGSSAAPMRILGAPGTGSVLLPDAIIAQALRTPDRRAVEAPDGSGTTYAELVFRADQVAARLRGARLEPGSVVLVAARRDVDLLPALLGVWFAGAGYLPLDPDQPPARWEQLLAEGRPGAVVLGNQVEAPVPLVVPVVSLGSLGSPSAGGPWPARVRAHPADVAYGILTSGSTGRPKVAAVTHAGLANRVRHAIEGTGINAADRILQKTTIGFDAAAWELFAPLTIGGTAVLAATGVEHDPDALYSEIRRRRTTVLQAVPTVLRHLLAASGADGRIEVAQVCSAGEPLTADLCRSLTARGVVAVENTYGPTECAIDVTSHRWSADQTEVRVPIGRPIDGADVEVVDDELGVCAEGTDGELWLRGTPVGAGYLHRPDLTAALFVPDPWGPPGARAFRSGDLGHRDVTGTLHYVGRRDDQVKINGVRVEPAEVAAVVGAHPGVRTAVVLALPDVGGRPGLTAFVVGPAEVAEVRRFTRDRLPSAFIPRRWHRLDSIGQTASGKIDQQALIELARAAEQPPGTVDQTVTVTELDPDQARVADVWSSLLPGTAPTATDDFFALGGHSLLLARLAARLTQVAGRQIGVAELFARTSLAEQAELLAEPGDQMAAAVEVADPPRPLRAALSATQSRLWFLHRLEPTSPQYVVPWLTMLAPTATPVAVAEAWAVLTRRHEVLRTRFVDQGSEPYAVVEPGVDVQVHWREVTGSEVAAEVRRSLETPFDLAQTAWRAEVLWWDATPDEPGDQTGRGGSAMLVFAAHHIACDGVSLDVMADEFAGLLAAALDGRPGALSSPAPSFAAVVEAERRTRASGAYRHRLGDWRRRLSGAASTELITDRSRPAAWDSRGALHTFPLPASVMAGLDQLGRAGRATPFMTRLALVEALLWRRGQSDEIVVGTPVAARLGLGSDRVVGPLANTVVLRTQFDRDDDFAAVLAKVRESCLWALARQDVGFDDVVDAVQPPRDLARNPLFQIMVETEGMRGPGMGTDAAMGWSTAKFDLTFGFIDSNPGQPRGYLEYATALFDPATVEQLAAELVALASAVVTDPGTAVGRLPRPAAGAVETLDLNPWPTSRVPAGLGPRAAVAEQARLRPDTPAVESGDTRLSYGELDARVDATAARLSDLGVGVGDVVGVRADRGAAVVVALLALLQVGAAYVPLHPGHPPLRRAGMITASGARLVLADDLGAGEPVPVISLAEVTAEHLVGPPLRPAGAAEVHDRDLAYVIFTSGSTGEPKGVMIDRGAYAEHCTVIAAAYDIGPGDRVVQLSSLVFDVAMDQMAATLASGATVVIAGSSDWDPRDLADRLAGHRVSIMEITPAHYRELIGALEPDDDRLAGLALMNVGSDVVIAADARRWYAGDVSGRFLCNYGPTEATVTCTLYPVSAEDAAGRSPESVLPIGQPVPGTTARVLDRWLQPVPPGGVGELYLGGQRLARGYCGRTDLTADRFVPDPLGTDGARLYRTGDAVRLRIDGVLEFLGRLDRQVKVRGFRIEPGEIEGRLLEHPSVTAAAVTAADGGLTAWVVAPSRPDPAVLRDHLARSLPDYLIPSTWTRLEALPLTDSGKVDRARLVGGLEGAPLRPRHRVPEDLVARQVGQLWTEMLGVERVGLDDDFFLLGGHSLLAVRVHALIREAFLVDLPLRVLFEQSTLGGLADAVRAAVVASVDELSDEQVRRLVAEETS